MQKRTSEQTGNRARRKVVAGCGILAALGVMLSLAVFTGLALGGWLNTREGRIELPLPQLPPPPEPAPPHPGPPEPAVEPSTPTGEGTVLVRVAGTEGQQFSGYLSGGSSEQREVNGTIPQEYEIPIGTGEDSPSAARAELLRESEEPGELRIELLHNGEVVNSSETAARNGSAGAAWSPQYGPFADDARTVVNVRVVGDPGSAFEGYLSGNNRSWSVEGTTPQEYEVEITSGEESYDSARAYFRRPYSDDTEKTLGLELVHEGEVVNEVETSARSGDVNASWSPDDVPLAEQETEIITVRVTGPPGVAYTGNVGNARRSWSVEGTETQEYDVEMYTAEELYDRIRAYFYRTTYEDAKGTLTVELIRRGEIIAQAETEDPNETLTVHWPPQ